MQAHTRSTGADVAAMGEQSRQLSNISRPTLYFAQFGKVAFIRVV